MRAWKLHSQQVDALGAELLFLAGDDPDLLKQKVAERGLDDLNIAHATPEQWKALGVQNPARPKLPHPTTLVLAPDGTELLRDAHENFRTRTDPERALAALQGALPDPPGLEGPAPVDWDDAARVSVQRQGTTVRFVLEIGDGFHAYGRKEEVGVPVYLRIDDGPRGTAPDGEPRRGALGTSWLLEGDVELSVELPDDPETVSGMIGWQLCTDDSCSAPRNEPFELARGARKAF